MSADKSSDENVLRFDISNEHNMYRTILEGLFESNWNITSFPITYKKKIHFKLLRMVIYIKKIHQNGDDNGGNEMEKSVYISMQSNQPVLIRDKFSVCVCICT